MKRYFSMLAIAASLLTLMEGCAKKTDSISGRVMDACTGKGFKDEHLVLRSKTGGDSLTATTNDKGEYLFSGVKSDLYELRLANKFNKQGPIVFGARGAGEAYGPFNFNTQPQLIAQGAIDIDFIQSNPPGASVVNYIASREITSPCGQPNAYPLSQPTQAFQVTSTLPSGYHIGNNQVLGSDLQVDNTSQFDLEVTVSYDPTLHATMGVCSRGTPEAGYQFQIVSNKIVFKVISQGQTGSITSGPLPPGSPNQTCHTFHFTIRRGGDGDSSSITCYLDNGTTAFASAPISGSVLPPFPAGGMITWGRDWTGNGMTGSIAKWSVSCQLLL